ncbi:MAG: anti-sigma factor [Vicinamibacterales bacterium]
MTDPVCTRIALTRLTDYATGDLLEGEAAQVEEHLFSCPACAARAAELDGLVRGIGAALRTSSVSGFVTDEILNRMSRDGLRLRTYVLSPGTVVPCAVWDDDDLMVTRLRGKFGEASEVTLSQRIGGSEVGRMTSEVLAAQPGEVIFVAPAAAVRDLPEVEVELVLTGRRDGEEWPIGRYTLAHGGTRRR